ncbi:hypothetical protein BVC80_1595g2 [Macleaya cordata]|uniref:Uncharacterized protein n=1 Tax=Macleaya cordata TaxID=56857 RepID=A0A200QI65_MACCD|nr:hypothetical protein BVC80_1595g2 [Macleaya cordata]
MAEFSAIKIQAGPQTTRHATNDKRTVVSDHDAGTSSIWVPLEAPSQHLLISPISGGVQMQGVGFLKVVNLQPTPA